MTEFVLLKEKNEFLVGFVTQKKKQTLIISKLNNNGSLESVTTTISKIQLEWTEPLEKQEELKQQLATINGYLNENLRISFEILKPGKYSLKELAAALNVKNDVFLFIQILKTEIIKRKNNEFIILSKDEVKFKQLQQKVKLWYFGDGSLSSDDSAELLEKILSIFYEEDHSEHWNCISNIFGFKKNFHSYEVQLRNIMEKLNYKISWDEFYIKKNKLNNDFKMSIVIEKFEEMQKKQSKNRKKYTTNTFTIDSEKTRDFDDAFTIVDFNDHSITIAVHITDISSYIHEFPEILKTSKSRMKSVYLLDKIFPMMPKELSENLFSLKKNEERLAISYKFKITNDAVVFENIHLSTIVVQENLSYESIENEMEQSFWKILSLFCENIHQRRMKLSESSKEFQEEFTIDTTDRENIKVSKSMRRIMKSSMTINELAILVNSFSGQYLCERSISCILKNQSKFMLQQQSEKDIYAQCTSPIRRFTDLINQIQIVSSLNDSQSFTKKELEAMIPHIQSQSESIMNLELKYKKYWLYIFIHQNKDQKFLCEILQVLPQNCEVKFVDYSFTMPVQGLKNVQKGDILELNLSSDCDSLILTAK